MDRWGFYISITITTQAIFLFVIIYRKWREEKEAHVKTPHRSGIGVSSLHFGHL
jgi:hypothetical protein